MEYFWLVFLVIAMIVFIIIFVITIVVAFNGNSNSTANKPCGNQTECGSGYVCTNTETGQFCKAGLGVDCENDNDCTTNLICTQIGNQQSKVCTYKPPTGTFEQKVSSENDPVISLAQSNPESQVATGIEEKSARTLNFEQPTVTPLSVPERKVEDRLVFHGLDSRSVTPLSQIIKQTPNKRLQVASPVSPDDEINSNGSREDQPFDVRSADSEDEEQSVSTPCQERNGVYYCRDKIPETIENPEGSSKVLDVCTYSNGTVFLLVNGSIICEIKNGDSNKRYRAVNNVNLIRVLSYDGYLYGLSHNGKLFILSNECFPTSNWMWIPVRWSPVDITYISASHDSSCLWIQTVSDGYLYGENNKLISNQSYTNKRRVLGKDDKSYIEIDDRHKIATVYPEKLIISDIKDAVLSYYNEALAIQSNESDKYLAIRMVNWKPYYIRA
jgi:hypothetical protein